MKAKILPNLFISVAVLFVFTQLLGADMSDGVLNFSDTPLVHRHPTFITFDVPGSTSTFPAAINPEGTITGRYSDASNVAHGFERAPKGAITTFDPPWRHKHVPRSHQPGGDDHGILR